MNEVEHARWCSKVNKAIKTELSGLKEQLGGFKKMLLNWAATIGHAGMLLIWDFLPIFDTNFAQCSTTHPLCVGLSWTNQYFKQLRGHCAMLQKSLKIFWKLLKCDGTFIKCLKRRFWTSK